MRARQAGFTLIEVLVATAIFTVVTLGAFEMLRVFAADASQLRTRHDAYAALEALTQRLRSEARSATAIWSSSPAAQSGRDGCVQFDFYAADPSGTKFWSYRTFPQHASGDSVPPDALERLAGSAPLAPCDPSLAGEIAIAGLTTAPRLGIVPPAALGTHVDPYLGVPDSPFVAASVPPTTPIGLGVLDASGTPVTGGNTILEVRLDTGAASRTIDLLAGVFPSGFTHVLRFTCSARCDVGHDAAAAKTLTACAMTWQTLWSRYVAATGAVSGGGWFFGGTFTFAYSGTRADGGVDRAQQADAASNWDGARDYTAYPPNGPGPDGSLAGSFAPWDVRVESAPAWYADSARYIAVAQRAQLAADAQRCDAVQAAGTDGSYANG